MVKKESLLHKDNIMKHKQMNENEYVDKFIDDCKIMKNKLTLKNINGLDKEVIAIYDFRTKNSADVKYNIINVAEKSIDRMDAINKLYKYIGVYYLSHELEKGLFEFSLINVTMNRLLPHFVSLIYDDKLNDICQNLDINSRQIDNQTLLPMIQNLDFDPYFVAFMRPEQLHPKKWNDVMLKMQIKDEVQNTFQTTDIYTCKKCKSKKFKLTSIQLRCSDEPTNVISTCMVCFYTFII